MKIGAHNNKVRKQTHARRPAASKPKPKIMKVKKSPNNIHRAAMSADAFPSYASPEGQVLTPDTTTQTQQPSQQGPDEPRGFRLGTHYKNKNTFFSNNNKPQNFRSRYTRDDPLTALLGSFAFSYIARTAADKETSEVEQHDLVLKAQQKMKRKALEQQQALIKQKKKPMPSAALDLQEQPLTPEAITKLHSNIISAEAVTKTIHNIFRQTGVKHRDVTSTELQDMLNDPESPMNARRLQVPTTDADALEAAAATNEQNSDNNTNNNNDTTTSKSAFEILKSALDWSKKNHKKKMAPRVDENGQEIPTEDYSSEDIEESTAFHTMSHKKKSNDNKEDDSETTLSKQKAAKMKRSRQRMLDEIKRDVPDLQKNIFNELDNIVEFANMHYQKVLKALSQHSLASLYPAELLAVEFFDYRLEIFLDAVQEDLGALYKAKKHFYIKHLKDLLDSGELSVIEHEQHLAKVQDLFKNITYVNLKDVKTFFSTIQLPGTTVEDVYADQELGFTSYDTTFSRATHQNLDDEIKVVEEMYTAMTEEMFSVKKFETALNLAAHRYPGLNVPVEKYIEQLSLEHQSITNAVDEYTELTENLTKMGRASQLSPLQDHVLRWFQPLSESIDAEINNIKNNAIAKLGGKGQQQQDEAGAAFNPTTTADVKMILPYISTLKSTELGCIALHETLSKILNAPNGLRVIDLALAIGKVVNTEANLHKLRQDRNNWNRLRRYYPGAKLNDQVIRRAVNNQNRDQQLEPTGVEDNTVWSDLIQAKIGSFLIKHMLASASIRQEIDPNTGQLRSVDRQFVVKKKKLSPNSGQAAANDDQDDSSSLGVAELDVPAFVYEHRQIGPNFVGYLTSHDDVRNVLEKAHTDVQTLSIRLLPMVIPPRPWRGTRDGGYLSVPSTVIRSKGSRKQVTAVENSNIEAIFQSLNYLGRVAWGINNHVLSVIDQAWTEGGGFAAMPSRRDIPAPPQPVLNLLQYDEKLGRYFAPNPNNAQHAAGVNPEQLAQQTTQWRQWQRDTQRISQYNADLHSLRCDLQLRLNQARQLAHQPVYFPLNMDFRGRTYPIPPHLNHLGSDLARALLVFHNRKPLGPKGMYWLKAHLAAQFGVDKVSFDDRVKYVEEHMELVYDTAKRPFVANVKNPHYGKLRSLDEPLYPIPREVQHKYARVYIRQQVDLETTPEAKKARQRQLLKDYASQGLELDMSIEDDPEECIYPLDGERDVRAKLPWWQLADSPWQALATCSEIVAALESGNPEKYECGLPVHQDGSCNGLQHYAALGRDYAGGSRVNLTNSDKPQDVYSHVLHEVKRRMEMDMEQSQNPLAKMLLPYINRKVVKQTVMTSVYGVTFIGARDQILKQLRDLKDVPWDQASELVINQQQENRKKFLQKQSESENRRKQRDRAKLLKNMTEAQRIDFLNREMMEAAQDDNTTLHELLDEYDQERQDQLADITQEDGGRAHIHGVSADDEDDSMVAGGEGVVLKKKKATDNNNNNNNADDVDQNVLISQRQAQEAAMRASAIYLARLTLTSLGTVFSAATRIMSWLTECAGIISKHEQPVSWITPLELPVVQHYRLISKFQVKTLNQTVTLHHDNDTLPVSPQRQRAAFPPNFVHSLDATHMMLTSMQCAKHGLVFSSVHDSYWTHPGDVDKMNALLRDQFITLYSQPILEDLRESFVLRYPTAEFPPLPERGDLDLEEVRKSSYFFN